MAEALTFPHPEGGTVLEHLVSAGICSRSAANALGLLDRTLTAREIADRHSAAVFRLDLYKTQKEIRRRPRRQRHRLLHLCRRSGRHQLPLH